MKLGGSRMRDPHSFCVRYGSTASAGSGSSFAITARTLLRVQVRAQELARRQLAAPRHRERRVQVLGQEAPRDLALEVARLRLGLAAQVVVGDPRDVEVAAHRDAGPHRHARVDLEQLELVVAVVVRELDVAEAAVARCLEQA